MIHYTVIVTYVHILNDCYHIALLPNLSDSKRTNLIFG